MSGIAIEAYLARLYADPAARETFLADPVSAARAAGLGEGEANSLRDIDRAGLRMAAASYAHKREQHRRPKMGWYESLRQLWGKH
jgi:hypothetical protein